MLFPDWTRNVLQAWCTDRPIGRRESVLPLRHQRIMHVIVTHHKCASFSATSWQPCNIYLGRTNKQINKAKEIKQVYLGYFLGREMSKFRHASTSVVSSRMECRRSRGSYNHKTQSIKTPEAIEDRPYKSSATLSYLLSNLQGKHEGVMKPGGWKKSPIK